MIALEPYYDSYAACIAMAGGTRVPVTLRVRTSGAFRLDLDELRDAVTDRTRLLLLNTPHNPTGTVLTREELAAIAALAVERDLLVVTDEVYEHLVFDEAEHMPLATFPGMRERTVTIGSAGKTFSFTGWKVGWVTAAPALVARRPLGQAVPDLRLGGPVPVRGRRGARASPDAYFDAASATICGPSGTCSATGLAEAGFEVFRPRGHLLRHHRHPPRSARATASPSAAPCRNAAGVVAIPNAVFYDHREEGRRSSGSRSASARRCWRRPSHG